MLHWLRQKLIRRDDVVARFIVVSVALHGMLIVGIFFSYAQSPDFNFSISRSSSHAIVQLLPVGAIKPVVKKGVQLKKKLQKEGLSNHKKIKKNTAENRKKTAVLKDKNKKNKQIKKQHTKEVAKQDESIPEPIVEPVIEKKEEIVPEAVKEESIALEKIDVPVVQNGADVPAAQEEILYVTQKELDVLQLQQQLKDAIEQVWTSPFGMAEDIVCEVLLVIGWDGRIVEKTLTKPTDIYIYDRAVEDALDLLTFPQQLWGKSIAIAFKP